MNLEIPPRLSRGDTIGVVSPSSGIAKLFPHRVEGGVNMLKSLGYEVKLSNHALEMNGWVSASPEERAEDINVMFADDSIKGMICMIGGMHANQILKYIDYDLVKQNPKIFIGYSDITVLHYAFATKANLQTYYGPCLISEIAEYPKMHDYTLRYMLKVITDSAFSENIEPSSEYTEELLDWSKKDDQKRPRKMTKSSGYTWWREGKATSQIIGGCFPTVQNLVGTDYWIDPVDKIFFIDIPESSPGQAYSQAELDVTLANLDNIGFFNSLKGLIIGRPAQYTEMMVKKLKEMIFYYIKETDYPVLYNVNIGHVAPIITVPIGSRVTLDYNKNIFFIEN